MKSVMRTKHQSSYEELFKATLLVPNKRK